MSEDLRARILAELTRHTGKQVPAAFVKNTESFLPGITRFHNLITGIFKPAWSEYALSIAMFLESPYDHKDEIVFLKDGRWLMQYSPRFGGLSIADNRALAKCLADKVPLGVFKQLTPKTDREQGSTYLVLGLGMISSYDAKTDVFYVEGVDSTALKRVIDIIPDEEERCEVELYYQLTNEFQPLTQPEVTTYNANRIKREEAFREIVLREYDHTCAVCRMKFRLGRLVEATAAHIIAKRESGTDDPRNGLALCRTHHWAFDTGLFSLNDSYELIASPSVEKAEMMNFKLLELQSKTILLPENPVLFPHPKALAWHRTHILRQ